LLSSLKMIEKNGVIYFTHLPLHEPIQKHIYINDAEFCSYVISISSIQV